MIYEISLSILTFQGAPGSKGPRGEKGEIGPVVSIVLTCCPCSIFSRSRKLITATLFSEVIQYEDFSHVCVTVGSSWTSWRDGSRRPNGSSRTSRPQWALHSRRSCKSSFWLFFPSYFNSFPVHCLCTQPVLSSEL